MLSFLLRGYQRGALILTVILVTAFALMFIARLVPSSEEPLISKFPEMLSYVPVKKGIYNLWRILIHMHIYSCSDCLRTHDTYRYLLLYPAPGNCVSGASSSQIRASWMVEKASQLFAASFSFMYAFSRGKWNINQFLLYTFLHLLMVSPSINPIR